MKCQATTVWPVAESREEGAAFGRLYDRYARMVHGILLTRVPPHEVDDLVHEVFLSALRQLHALGEISRLGARLAAITHNRANDHYRKSGPEAALTGSTAKN